jgi:hypothetical protein
MGCHVERKLKTKAFEKKVLRKIFGFMTKMLQKNGEYSLMRSFIYRTAPGC